MKLLKYLLAAALALAPLPNVNAAGWLPLVKPAGGAPFYVKAGNIAVADGGTGSNSFTSAIGTATATRVILIGVVQGNSTAFTSITVNGVTATAIFSGTSRPEMQFFQITGTAPGSGTQTVTLNGGAFFVQIAQVWYMDNLNSTTVKQTAKSSGNPPVTTNINITAGDFLFSIIGSGQTGFSWSSSTDPVANSATLSNGTTSIGNADWTTVSTNASWAATVSWAANTQEQMLVSFR